MSIEAVKRDDFIEVRFLKIGSEFSNIFKLEIQVDNVRT